MGQKINYSSLEERRNVFSSYRGVDKSVARPGRKQANISVRMAWISFGALPCRKKKHLMTARVSMLLKSPRPWHGSELVSFLVGLRTYQHPGTPIARMSNFRLRHIGLSLSLSLSIYIYRVRINYRRIFQSHIFTNTEQKYMMLLPFERGMFAVST